LVGWSFFDFFNRLTAFFAMVSSVTSKNKARGLSTRWGQPPAFKLRNYWPGCFNGIVFASFLAFLSFFAIFFFPPGRSDNRR
jgi:hypothetical protein